MLGEGAGPGREGGDVESVCSRRSVSMGRMARWVDFGVYMGQCAWSEV